MALAKQAVLGLFLCGCTHAMSVGKTAGGGFDAPPASKSVAALRARGQQGLDEALRTYDALQAELAKLKQQENELHSVALFGEPGKADRDAEAEARFTQIRKQVNELDRRIGRAAAAIDQIGGQRSCTVSRLYWHTDLEEAKKAAAASDRPILSLRMLGKLTDEYSCANSRFFRTALYSNKKLSDFLRTNFVLHWQSVRPVPRVTIDFGDGRRLERTLTGNSAHYVLASDGTPLDVLPGLYSPLAFQQWAWDVRHFYIQYQKAAPADRGQMLIAFHKQQNEELLKRWDFDIQRLGGDRAELASLRINHALTAARLAGQDVPAELAPKAVVAAKQAVGKTAAEAPVLRFAKLGGTWMERGMDDELWQAVADLHREDVQLDEASVAVVRREAPPAKDAARRAVSKYRVEDPILQVVRSFEEAMGLDTVRNEYLLHRRIHEQFAAANAVTANVDTLNGWVYAELFLTPSGDPWLGLAPRDVYTALEGDGRTEAARLPDSRAAAGESPFTGGG
jgi:hypothetical protein